MPHVCADDISDSISLTQRLRELGLPVSGRKSDLIDRILNSRNAPAVSKAAQPGSAAPPPPALATPAAAATSAGPTAAIGMCPLTPCAKCHRMRHRIHTLVGSDYLAPHLADLLPAALLPPLACRTALLARAVHLAPLSFPSSDDLEITRNYQTARVCRLYYRR